VDGASRPVVIATLGAAQILAWGSSYYLPAVLAQPIATDTGWPLAWVVGGVSLGLLVAGLASPRVGRIIEARGGRAPMAASTLLMAAGLVALTVAPTLALHVACWAVIGLGMAAGLYDATFATLGRQYGQQARGAIASMTLIGGFANTVCWPLSAFLLGRFGWRGACLGYAAIDVFLLLPAYLLVLPRRPPPPEGVAKVEAAPPPPAGPVLFGLLAAVNTVGLLISATFSVHLLNLLVARGLAPAVAVSFGAALGPAQIAGRLAIIFGAQRLHPVWTLLAWTALVAIGLVLLSAWPGALAVALACYGAGIGIGSIARGTVPLALFGAGGYATRMGRLALPALLAQAAAPVLFALLLQHAGAATTLGVLAGVAGADLLLTLALVIASRPQWQNAAAS
jgi:predicted MFS family arabinose efflux permease